jgi:hypothetical protein
VKRTTTVTGPDGKVTTTTTKTSGGCGGCITFLVIALALGFMIEAWEGSNLTERIVEVAILLIVVIGVVRVYQRRAAKRDQTS